MGSRAANCKKAIRLLDIHPEILITAQSGLYESEPIGEIEQNWFINAAVAVETTLPPENLLNTILKIETELGRKRREKWGPRVIDLDILAYEDRVIRSISLILPHPEMTKRRFVLLPLSEFAGGYTHPVQNKTIQDLLNELPELPRVKKIASQS